LKGEYAVVIGIKSGRKVKEANVTTLFIYLFIYLFKN